MIRKHAIVRLAACPTAQQQLRDQLFFAKEGRSWLSVRRPSSQQKLGWAFHPDHHIRSVDIHMTGISEALLVAADVGDAALLDTLLSDGADANGARAADGMTFLMAAASSGHTACVQILLDRGADPAVADEDGDTALTHARINGRSEVEQLLRRRGARIVLQI